MVTSKKCYATGVRGVGLSFLPTREQAPFEGGYQRNGRRRNSTCERCWNSRATPGHHLIESTGRCGGDREASPLPCRYGVPGGATKTLKASGTFSDGNAASAITKSRRPLPISGP